jgi:hypothetical protein
MSITHMMIVMVAMMVGSCLHYVDHSDDDDDGAGLLSTVTGRWMRMLYRGSAEADAQCAVNVCNANHGKSCLLTFCTVILQHHIPFPPIFVNYCGCSLYI